MSYGTLSGANAYHTARGNAAWNGTDEQKTIALLRGSEYVDFNFRDRFPGYKTGLRDQEREWPRSWAFDIENNSIPADEVPDEVVRATYEAALRELVSPGSLMPDVTLGKQIKAARVEGAVSVEYVGAVGLAGLRPLVSVVSAILAPILTAVGGSSIAGRSERV